MVFQVFIFLFFQSKEERLHPSNLLHSLLISLTTKFHHEKEKMSKVSSGELVPYIFHMCWTQYKHEKLTNLKAARLWYVRDECSIPTLVERSHTDGSLFDACCKPDSYRPSIGNSSSSTSASSSSDKGEKVLGTL